jgi:hypothetical protein
MCDVDGANWWSVVGGVRWCRRAVVMGDVMPRDRQIPVKVLVDVSQHCDITRDGGIKRRLLCL